MLSFSTSEGSRLVRFLTTGLLITSGTLSAQIAGTGSIQGTITDPSGAVVPGASVVATNVATATKTERLTTSAGLYVLSPLPAGEYTVSVSAGGFQSHLQEHVIVDALNTVGLNVVLKVGAASEQVTITDTPPCWTLRMPAWATPCDRTCIPTCRWRWAWAA